MLDLEVKVCRLPCSFTKNLLRDAFRPPARLQTGVTVSQHLNTATLKDVQKRSWRYYAPLVFSRSFLMRGAKTKRGAGQNAYSGGVTAWG